MADDLGRILSSVDNIEQGISTIKEGNARRDEWAKNTDKRLDHLYDKKLPNHESRLDKVEAFQIKLGVGLAILPFLIPVILNYIYKLMVGE